MTCRSALTAIAAVTLAGAFLTTSTGCRRHDKGPISPTPPDWLVTVVHDQAQQEAPGAKLIGDLYQGVAYREDDRTEYRIALEQGSCYWFSTAGDQQVRELYLNLWDPSDKRVARVKEERPKLMLSHCASTTGMYKFEVKVTEGWGHFEFGLYAQPAPGKEQPAVAQAPSQPAAVPPDEPVAPPPIDPSDPGSVVPEPLPPDHTDLGAVADKEAKAAAPGAVRVGEHFFGNAPESDWYTTFEADKCYWLIGVSGDGVQELHLHLWDPEDRRVKSNRSQGGKASIGYCPNVPGMYNFQAKVNRGKGAYVVGIYAKDR